MTNVFKLFKTNSDLEKNGVWENYGDFRVKIARAGGTNTRYNDLLQAKIRPVKHQVERGTLPREEDQRISAELYAEALIKDIQVRQADGSWKTGVPTEAGDLLDFNTKNVIEFLLALPDFFTDLKQSATNANKYLQDEEEAAVKNSKQS